MADKKYNLELTAEDLESYWATSAKVGGPSFTRQVRDRIMALAAQARADKERDELRLPWRAEKAAMGGFDWVCMDSRPHGGPIGERAAKLRSAAPELLEAVQAWVESINCSNEVEGFNLRQKARDLSFRALRKVETGEPE